MSTKDEYIGLRATSAQRQWWEAAAAKDRRTLTDWIRIQLDDAATKAIGPPEELKPKRK